MQLTHALQYKVRKFSWSSEVQRVHLHQSPGFGHRCELSMAKSIHGSVWIPKPAFSPHNNKCSLRAWVKCRSRRHFITEETTVWNDSSRPVELTLVIYDMVKILYWCTHIPVIYHYMALDFFFLPKMIHMLDQVNAMIQPNPHIIWSLDKMTTV